MRTLNEVVVVGASLAGLRACEALRTGGFAGRITLVGAETHLPYHRPPLSKQILAGEWDPERAMLRTPSAYDSLGLDWRPGTRAVALDSGSRRITLDDDAVLAYDGLVIATGATPRLLPGQPDLDGIFVLRTIEDALALRARLDPGMRLVVIGAGFIGLEAAATARRRGADVVVLEGAPAPLIRGLGAEMGAVVAGIHEREGVRVRCSVVVDRIEGEAGRVTGVRLGDGEFVPADAVLVGIGVAPATGWLEGSGLQLGDGVVCDESLFTGASGTYAAGDCVYWPNPLFAETARIEHWTNAAEQGAHAAKNLLTHPDGGGEAYGPVPFFWSEQHGARIQFLGRSAADDEIRIVAGGPDEGRMIALYGRAERLHGVLGISMTKEVMAYRDLLARAVSWGDALGFAASQQY